MDATYLRGGGRWCDLDRAVDRNGNLVDVRLSERRDLKAARAFFRSAKVVTGVVPARVTTDGHDSDPAATRSELGRDVRHRTSTYLNNLLSRTIAASRAGIARCAASGRLPQPGGSAVAMTSCAPFCGPDRTAGSMFQPTVGG